MSRAQRLLELIQALRRRRAPVTGAALAEELGISLRTLYRDIATLQAQGAHIDGEPGIGYILRPGFMLPPLMFTDEEIEALVLGSRWIAERADDELARAAHNALAKIGAVLPRDLHHLLEDSGLVVVTSGAVPKDRVDLSVVRRAIRTERKLAITYLDANGTETRRTVWPISLGFFDRARVIAAWCEMRQGFRHFRTDRILDQKLSGAYPRRRKELLQEWRAVHGIAPRPPT